MIKSVIELEYNDSSLAFRIADSGLRINCGGISLTETKISTSGRIVRLTDVMDRSSHHKHACADRPQSVNSCRVEDG